MLFNSYVFLFAFLPIAVVGYYLLAHRVGTRAAKIWLSAASFVFYGWWNAAFVLLLVGSIAFNFWISLRVQAPEATEARRTAWLTFGVTANLLLLFFYKYLFPLLGFFDELGWSHFDYGSIILPLGISFFTFTQIGFLVDCRQGVVSDRGLLSYVLFVTFFPHLIAGPILHHREIMPQFANEASYRFKADNLSVGLTLFALGLCKKVLFADSIAPWAEAGFDHPLGLDMLNAWSVVLAYSMQLYFDFSGYSDMAIGIGIMFGIKLPLNFNSPYKSASIIDFWQRWHMTLTRYITLLLYNPIALWVVRLRTRSGASTGKKAAATPAGFASMIAFPTITTMLLAGIWHGAGFQYVVFGLLHGLYLTINHAWRIFRATPSKAALRPVSLVWRVALTYLAVLLAQVFFRAHSASDAMAIIAGMIGLHGSGLPVTIPLANAQHFGAVLQPLIDMNLLVVGLRETYNALTLPLAHNLALAIALLVIAFTTPNVYQMLGDWSPAYTKVKAMSGKLLLWRPAWPVAIGFGVLLFFLSLRFGSSARFLYFQF